MSVTRRTFLTLSAPAAGAFLAFAGCSRKPSTAAETGRPTSWDKRTARIEALIRQSMTHLHVPGVSLAVIRDARIAYTKAFGVSNQESGTPVDDDTVFSA